MMNIFYRDYLHKILFILAILAALVLAIIYCQNWLAALSWPFSISYEGPILWACETLSKGKNIYPLIDDFNQKPWICTIYPPVYMLTGALLLKLFPSSYFILRCFEIFLSLGILIFSSRILCLLGVKAINVFLAQIFFFSFAVVSGQSFIARPDFLAIFFSLIMIERAIAFNLINKSSNLQTYSFKQLCLLASLAALSVLSKQQGIVFILSLVIFYLIDKRIKDALRLFLIFVVALLISVFFIQQLSGGFYQNLTLLFHIHPKISVLFDNLNHLGADWAKILLVILVLPFAIAKMKVVQSFHKLPFILFFVSTIVFYFSMSIPASNTHHVISALLALSWCLAVSLDTLSSLLILPLLFVSLLNLPLLAEEGLLRPKLQIFALEQAKQLQKLGLENKPVLTDDPNICFLTKSDHVLIDAASTINFWHDTSSDLRYLSKDLANKSFAAVIINTADSCQKNSPENKTINWWTSDFINCLQKYYHKQGEYQCSGWSMDLYLPK